MTKISGYVYLIGTPIFGWYKIGKSKTPEVRVKDLGILLPFKIKVIGVWKAENHHLLESSLHEIYSEFRINGEWFEFQKKEVYKIADSIPSCSRVYPADGNIKHELDSFSNVFEDTSRLNPKKEERRVIGVRCEKLRGDFTPEERMAKRKEGEERSKRRREEKELAKRMQ